MAGKLRIAAALALAALTGGCGGRAPDADPALWAVRDGDTTIYLFGTVHVLRPNLGWFDDGVKRAFDASDTLVLELVMPSDAETQAIVRDLAVAKDGKRLLEAVPDKTRRKLMVELPKLGLPPDALDRDEAWYAAVTLGTLPLRRLGYHTEDGAEAVLSKAAHAANKQVVGLETLREQLGYFDTLSPPAQQALLIETVDALPDASKDIDRTVAAWSKGDADALAALANAELTGSSELRQRLLLDRNRRWADWIAARMRTPGTVFVAVGAGHLAGPDSVQAELARHGLKVERVAY